MGNPMDLRSMSARQRAAHYREQAVKLRQMAEAQPAKKICAKLIELADQYQLLANSLGDNQHDRLA
jgi:hypothetical protein